MIHVGDKVRIAVTGAIYSTYPGFLDYFRNVAGSTMVERVCEQYEYGYSPTDEEVRGKVFTVMFIREHGSMEGDILAIINDGTRTYIIKVDGLILVSSDLLFTEGDKVYISDSGATYSAWEDLVKNMCTVIPNGEEVCRLWTREGAPLSDEVGGSTSEALFTVVWVGHHVSRPDEAVIAIITNGRHSYLIGVAGLTKIEGQVGDTWNKYIVYVRNWAVVNREQAQSTEDVEGPKSYSKWLENK